MKRLAISPCKLALFGSIAAFSILLLPASNAIAELGTWTYPNTLAEKAKRIDGLNQQLEDLDKLREEQLIARTEAEETLVELLGQLQAAEGALKTQKAPLQQALEKYRQAQEIALSDPMIDVEPQRLEYVRIENETAATIKSHLDEIDQINQLISQTTESFSNTRNGINVTLHQIDNLWQHRNNIDKIVFLRTVAD